MSDGPAEVAAANASRLARLERLARGWHARSGAGGWTDRQARLEEQLLDPAHRAAIAREELRTAYRDDELTDSLRWLASHPARYEGP